MEQNKRTLLAYLTLWQEAARNAQKKPMGRVVFEPKEMERVCGQLRAYIEETGIQAIPLEEGQFRITIEDGNDGSVEVLKTDIFDLFYVKDDDDLYIEEGMAVRDKLDEHVFYFALRELCENKNKDSNGMLESMYEKYKAHCCLEKNAGGDVC